jgi:quercetin dioxygenase-like cupin family protein
MTGKATAFRWDEVPVEQVSPTLARRLISGERVMLAQVSLTKDCIVPKHQHVHEQITVVTKGALHFRIGDEGKEIIIRSGGVLHIPSDVPHEAVVLEDSEVLDVFSPPREDWIAGTDTYLRR